MASSSSQNTELHNDFAQLDSEEIKRFIELRGKKHKSLFTGIRGSAEAGMRIILKELDVVHSDSNIKKAKKKWENLLKKYKDLKNPKSGSGIENGEDTKNNWAYYDDIDRVLAKDHNINPPHIVSSLVPVSKDNTRAPSDCDSECDMKVSPEPSGSSSSTKKKKIISSPDKTSERKKKSTLSSRMRKAEKKESKFNKAVLTMISKDRKEKKKEKKRLSRRTNALLSLIGASVLSSSDPDKAKEMVDNVLQDAIVSSSSEASEEEEILVLTDSLSDSD